MTYMHSVLCSNSANCQVFSPAKMIKPLLCPLKVQCEPRHVALPSGCSLSTRHGLMTVTALLTLDQKEMRSDNDQVRLAGAPAHASRERPMLSPAHHPDKKRSRIVQSLCADGPGSLPSARVRS